MYPFYLDRQMIDLLLVYYYESPGKTAELLGIIPRQVISIRDFAFRDLQMAFSMSDSAPKFCAEEILQRMAISSNRKLKDLIYLIQSDIEDSMMNQNLKIYWERVPRKGPIPTPEEFLNHVFSKYEKYIYPIHWEV